MQLEPLLPDAQPLDQTSISLVVVFSEIIEQPSPLPYQLEETPAGVVILHVDLEVLREVIDALTQQCNLNFRGASIGLMDSELLNDVFSFRLSNPHLSSVHHLSFFLVVIFLSHYSDVVKQPNGRPLADHVPEPPADPTNVSSRRALW
jgi:hypothetical protein